MSDERLIDHRDAHSRRSYSYRGAGSSEYLHGGDGLNTQKGDEPLVEEAIAQDGGFFARKSPWADGYYAENDSASK